MPDPDPQQPIELETPPTAFEPVRDNAVRIPEPLPVRLIAVEDVRLPTPGGIEEKLDRFYVGLLDFERVVGKLAYRADNWTLHLDVQEATFARESLRPLGVEVPLLRETEKRFLEAELQYTRQHGTTLGSETLLVLDPAGNRVEIGEIRRIL